jgi:hypothetical protein
MHITSKTKLGTLWSVILITALLASGCGKKLSGRYEYVPGTPRMDTTGLNAEAKRSVESDREKYQRLVGSALVFDGANATLIGFGEGGTEAKCIYRVRGKDLDVTMESRLTLPMELRADGIIIFNGAEFRKVK